MLLSPVKNTQDKYTTDESDADLLVTIVQNHEQEGMRLSFPARCLYNMAVKHSNTRQVDEVRRYDSRMAE